LLIRDLLSGKTRYSDFLASPEKIPTNILAERLRRLERAGLIKRFRYSQRPPRDSYLLTADGAALAQAIDALAEWGLCHFSGTRRAITVGRRGDRGARDEAESTVEVETATRGPPIVKEDGFGIRREGGVAP